MIEVNELNDNDLVRELIATEIRLAEVKNAIKRRATEPSSVISEFVSVDFARLKRFVAS